MQIVGIGSDCCGWNHLNDDTKHKDMDHTAFEDYVEGTICQSVIVIILVNELSFDNVGLIISPDMIYDSERARTD